MNQDAAAASLKSVSFFAFGGVGFAGSMSRGESDYNTLMAAPPQRAVAILLDVFQTGSPAAKAYALTGLKKLSTPDFGRLAAEARRSKQQVMTMHGCIGSQSTLADIARGLTSSNQSHNPQR